MSGVFSAHFHINIIQVHNWENWVSLPNKILFFFVRCFEFLSMKMTKHLFKLLLICFIISFEIINCSEIEREDTTESTDSSEVSDHISAEEGEDYEEYDEDQEPTSDPSFFEKFKQIHSENQNVSISLNVKHINQTFEVINNIQQKFGQFFKTDGKTGAEVLEFLSEIDVQLSAQCSASLFKIFTAVKNSEFWALKCKQTTYKHVNLYKLK